MLESIYFMSSYIFSENTFTNIFSTQFSPDQCIVECCCYVFYLIESAINYNVVHTKTGMYMFTARERFLNLPSIAVVTTDRTKELRFSPSNILRQYHTPYTSSTLRGFPYYEVEFSPSITLKPFPSYSKETSQ